MIWLVVLGVVAYLVIGGIVEAIMCIVMDDDDTEDLFGLVIFWPIFIGLLIVVGIYYLAVKIGTLIVTCVKQYLTTQSEEVEK